MTPPREVPSWDAYLMAVARVISTRSKDPSTQHGAVIADEKHRIVATGYNGPPPGIDDGAIDWSRPAKYPWVLHSEENALAHSSRPDLSCCTVYVTGWPCSRCLRQMAARGVRRVVYGAVLSACVDEADRAVGLAIAKAAGVVMEEWK